MASSNVLLVLNDPGFFLSHRLPLAHALQASGYRVTVVAPEGTARATIESKGFRFVPFPLSRKGLNPFQELGSLMALVKLYRELKPEIIHHFTIKPVIFGSIAAKLAGVPKVINSITGLGYVFTGTDFKARALRKVVQSLYRRALSGPTIQVIFQNPDDQQIFFQNKLVEPKQSHLIFGSGVNTDKYTPNEEAAGDCVVLMPARMLWHKGIGELIEASQILKNKGLKYKLLLAGGLDPGNPAAISEQQIREWEKQGLAHWAGHQSDMVQMFKNCHVVCLPSYREGIPLALLEGSAAGKPIVTTNAPGCREVVLNEETGLIVPVRNAPALATALEKLITHPELRKKMGNQGRAHILRKFDQKLIHHQFLEIYKTL